MPCLNRTLTATVGEIVEIRAVDVHSDVSLFHENLSAIVVGENDPDNATRVLGVTPQLLRVAASNTGQAGFTVLMADGQRCQFKVRVVTGSYSCPVPSPLIPHPENGGELCVSWDQLAIPENCSFGFPRPSVLHHGVPVSMTFGTRRSASCALVVTASAMSKFTLGDELQISYSVMCDGQNSPRCSATIGVIARKLPSEPFIVQCRDGVIQLRRGVAMPLELANSEGAAKILWSSVDPALVFNPPDRAQTTVTASRSGSFQVEVEYCFLAAA